MISTLESRQFVGGGHGPPYARIHRIRNARKKKLSDPLTRELKRATNAIYTFLLVLVQQHLVH